MKVKDTKDTVKITKKGVIRINMTVGNKVISFKFRPYDFGFISERQVRKAWFVGKAVKTD